ncbi:putative cadmium-transporting ATPase [Caulifigura coniformis]|uniref:Putative cadmium-transporting ATPase n=1 Tax=Caulifigura coniformis TaxID=2527983 RepID=A0A517SCQ9_9PLAN|nr:heavy metal translocating P-type ATPase [Caulifigura coniformis]QDT53911.1 putative cadmium-transporting ATPase [Caulifigura coniformis]
MSDQTHVTIGLVLPAVPDAHDACVQRLANLLSAQDGIEKAHLAARTAPGPDELCIHFDSTRLSVGEVRALAARAGAEIEHRFGHLLVRSQPLHARQALMAEARIKRIPGVLDAGLSPAGVLRVEFDRHVTGEADLREAVSKIGIRVLTPAAAPVPGAAAHEQGGLLGGPWELRFAILCGAALLLGWLVSWTSVTPWLTWGLYLAAYFFGGFFTFREAIADLRARRFEIDFLMLVAAVGAATLGDWFEGALLLFLFSLGHALEHYAMGRAKRAIESLAELAPQTALVRRDGKTEVLPVEQLRPGDIAIVKPNERLPADGFVVKGQSSVNQAPITGESVPVEKQALDPSTHSVTSPDRLAAQFRVFAGTINGSGALEVQVTKLASESTLARVVRMVSEAETQKSPTQRFADRFERYFVPAVLGFVVLLLFAWTIIDESFSESFYRAMAVLVAASPCALAISTPSAVLSGVARAARGGVLFKGGGPLENLGRVGTIAFDKTGTITEGKPRLTDVVPADGSNAAELLRVAVAVEALSDHPLAAAVVQGGKERFPGEIAVPAHDVESITGRGVKATVDGQTVYLGKSNLFSEIEGPALTESLRTSAEHLEASGRTTMIVRWGDKYLGVLGLMDTPRPAAAGVIARLRQLGIQKMLMLSGDNQQVANAVAQDVGLDEARGDLMPEDKVAVIKLLRDSSGVAMVGDGVNDAPAMANATVGIAMGAAGSHVALETADVALMADDLNHLPFAVGLSRQTSRIIRQNLWISLGMVAFLVPATLLGLRLGPAVLLHEGSTLLVVLNALRLLAYHDK